MNLQSLYSVIRGPERKELAERAGVSWQTLQVWATHWYDKKRGRQRKPTPDQIRVLAKADKRLTIKEMMEEFHPKGEKVPQ